VAENKIAVLTDTNSGISEQMQDVLGVFVVPMPVIMVPEIQTTVEKKSVNMV